MIDTRSTVVISKGQVAADLAEGMIILSLNSGRYYGLNDVGAHIWRLLQEAKSIGEIKAAILQEYEVDGDRVEGDLLALLQQMATEGLIELANGSSS